MSDILNKNKDDQGKLLADFLNKNENEPLTIIEGGNILPSDKPRPSQNFLKRIVDLEKKPSVKIGLSIGLTAVSPIASVSYGAFSTIRETYNNIKEHKTTQKERAAKIGEFLSKGMTKEAKKVKKDNIMGYVRPCAKALARFSLYGASFAGAAIGGLPVGIAVAATYASASVLKQAGVIDWAKEKITGKKSEAKLAKEAAYAQMSPEEVKKAKKENALQKAKNIAKTVVQTGAIFSMALLAGKVGQESGMHQYVSDAVDKIKNYVGLGTPEVANVINEPTKQPEPKIEPTKPEPIKAEPVKTEPSPLKPEPVKVEPTPEPIREQIEPLKPVSAKIKIPEIKPAESMFPVSNNPDSFIGERDFFESATTQVKSFGNGKDFEFYFKLDQEGTPMDTGNQLSKDFDFSKANISSDRLNTLDNETNIDGTYKGKFVALEFYTENITDKELFDYMSKVEKIGGMKVVQGFANTLERSDEFMKFYTTAKTEGIENAGTFVDHNSDNPLSVKNEITYSIANEDTHKFQQAPSAEERINALRGLNNGSDNNTARPAETNQQTRGGIFKNLTNRTR